jgi:hypothetical protein
MEDQRRTLVEILQALPLDQSLIVQIAPRLLDDLPHRRLTPTRERTRFLDGQPLGSKEPIYHRRYALGLFFPAPPDQPSQ